MTNRTPCGLRWAGFAADQRIEINLMCEATELLRRRLRNFRLGGISGLGEAVRRLHLRE
jgi:hypothetical protein